MFRDAASGGLNNAVKPLYVFLSLLSPLFLSASLRVLASLSQLEVDPPYLSEKYFLESPGLYFFGLAVTDSDWLHFSPMICDPITVHQGMWYCDWLWVMGSHAHWSGNNWYSQQGLMEWGMSSSKESEEGKWEHILGKKKKKKTTGHWRLLCVLCSVVQSCPTDSLKPFGP